MSFLVSKLLWMVIAPGSLLLIALLAASIGVRRAPRSARWLVRATTAALLAITVLPVGEWLARPLEERFPPPGDVACPIDGIIVLGGSIDPVVSSARDSPQLRNSAERLVEFATLARRHPDAKLVFTGGTGSMTHPEAKEAPWARRVLIALGVSEARLIVEDESRNTYENALLSKARVRPRDEERWLLVTSAMHIPRAVGVFRRVGWNLTPVPVDFRTAPGAGGIELLGVEKALFETGEAVREWVGLVSYWLLGRTSELFPAPEPPCGVAAARDELTER